MALFSYSLLNADQEMVCGRDRPPVSSDRPWDPLRCPPHGAVSAHTTRLVLLCMPHICGARIYSWFFPRVIYLVTGVILQTGDQEAQQPVTESRSRVIRQFMFSSSLSDPRGQRPCPLLVA